MMYKKIAKSTWCCKNIDDVLDLVRENRYVEWDLNTIPLSLNNRRMAYARDFIQDNGEVRFHLPHSFWDIGSKDKCIVENSFSYYCRLFEMIRFFDAQFAVIHIGAAPGSDEDTALVNLFKLVNYAYDNGVTLCVENLINGLSSNMGFIKKCLEIPHVNMCFDTGHAEALRKQDGESVFEDIELIKDKILHAHVYDYEDENINHVHFTFETIKTNVWLPVLQTTSCAWYTMELDSKNDQDKQKRLINKYLHNK